MAATLAGAVLPFFVIAGAELLFADVAAYAPAAKGVRESGAGDAIRTGNMVGGVAAVSGKRVAIYNCYWPSRGGGEWHLGMFGQVLADSGAQVDLVGHDRIDLDVFVEYFSVDLSGCWLRVVLDMGETLLFVFMVEYDFFVNVLYMSAMTSKAVKSIYLCYFFILCDHDFVSW